MKLRKSCKHWATAITLLTSGCFSAYIFADTASSNASQNSLYNYLFATPVFHLDTEYSNVYKAFVQAQYANTISANDAAALLLGFGSDQFRIGATWAHALTSNQRFKVGIEHFAQNNDYQFATGTDHEFNGQNAIGATYQYLFTEQILQAFEVSGYFAKAGDSDFPARTFTNSSGQTFVDNRDITGASLAGISLGPDLNLWPGAQLGMAVNYDTLHYSARYEQANNKSGFGGTLTFAQQLGNTLALNLSGSYRQPYDLYQASLDWLAHQSTATSLDLGIYASHLQSNVLLFSHENIVGLRLAYNWGGYTAAANDTTAGQLLNWAATSPAHLPAVFIMRDENITAQ